jgi:hypothetical protein
LMSGLLVVVMLLLFVTGFPIHQENGVRWAGQNDAL